MAILCWAAKNSLRGTGRKEEFIWRKKEVRSGEWERDEGRR
jgi:hypothetical protein